MELTVKQMTETDLDEIAQLEQLCFSTPWSRQGLAAELTKEGNVFLVARNESGDLWGYGGFNSVLDEGYITNIATHPDHRRQGVARRLMCELMTRAGLLGLRFLSLEVRPSNSGAIKLYSGLGFVEAGRRKGFYRCPAEDGIILTKFLEDNDAI